MPQKCTWILNVRCMCACAAYAFRTSISLNEMMCASIAIISLKSKRNRKSESHLRSILMIRKCDYFFPTFLQKCIDHKNNSNLNEFLNRCWWTGNYVRLNWDVSDYEFIEPENFSEDIFHMKWRIRIFRIVTGSLFDPYVSSEYANAPQNNLIFSRWIIWFMGLDAFLGILPLGVCKFAFALRFRRKFCHSSASIHFIIQISILDERLFLRMLELQSRAYLIYATRII